MLPAEELMYLHVHAGFKQLVLEQMDEYETQGDAVVRLVCQALQVDPSPFVIRRRPSGRPRGAKNRKKKERG